MRLGLLGLAIQPEKEVLLVVEEKALDRIPGALVKAGNLDQPGLGFVFVSPVDRVVDLLKPAPSG